MIDIETLSSADTIKADELPGREKTHIDGGPIGIAVPDDYRHAALSLADWSSLKPWASITIFHNHLAGADAVVARLKPFDVVCVMRDRTPLTCAILERLPSLKLVASTALAMPRLIPIPPIGKGSRSFTRVIRPPPPSN